MFIHYDVYRRMKRPDLKFVSWLLYCVTSVYNVAWRSLNAPGIPKSTHAMLYSSTLIAGYIIVVPNIHILLSLSHHHAPVSISVLQRGKFGIFFDSMGYTQKLLNWFLKVLSPADCFVITAWGLLYFNRRKRSSQLV